MIKRLCLVLVLISMCDLLIFGDAGEQKEVGFLLFMPNSGNRFVNEDKAMIRLDNMANYLMSRSLSPGQIKVYGYTAIVANDIESTDLSRDRALYVINELQKRGLGGDLFAEPIACGAVDLWDSNTDEGDRSLNRRVRVLVDDAILTSAELQAVGTGKKNPGEGNFQIVIQDKTAIKKTGSKFPWWIIPLALIGLAVIAAIIFFAYRRWRGLTGVMVQETIPPKSKKVPVFIPVAVVPPGGKTYVLTEEEIRRYAYELYQLRYGQNVNEVEDWHQSVHELTAYYEAKGYRVVLYWETLTKVTDTYYTQESEQAA